MPEEVEARYQQEYGDLYREALARVRAAKGKSITSLFELPKKSGRIKTEILFIERCLALLEPGGRLGIVLPEGIYNNPSLAYVREYVEDRAFIRAVVSLPQETFYSAGASVKASLLFLQKFTEQEQADFEKKQEEAKEEIEEKYKDEIATRVTALKQISRRQKNKQRKQNSRKRLETINARWTKRRNARRGYCSRNALLTQSFSMMLRKSELQQPEKMTRTNSILTLMYRQRSRKPALNSTENFVGTRKDFSLRRQRDCRYSKLPSSIFCPV